MMRIILALGVVLYCCQAGYSAPPTTLKDIMTHMSQCQQEFHIGTAEIMVSIRKKKLPETENGKCFMACFMKKMGAITDGKFDVKRILELNKERFKDPENLAKANKITKKCSDVQAIDGDECTMAYEAAKCGLNNALELNLKVPESVM